MITYREFKQRTIDSENKKQGDLKGYNCPICNNKGYVYYLDENDNECAKECKCMPIRYARANAEYSGLGNALKVYTLKRYTHNEKWQNYIYTKAINFINDASASCFFIGGAVGSGKSHICTAIVREFLKMGKDVQFAVWNETVTTLKQNIIENAESYNNKLDELQHASVLYIDDFFKTTPTEADIDKAFKIINYRYNAVKAHSNNRFITIISSEKTIDELLKIDEAIASRIVELAKDYTVEIQRDGNKNIRLKQVI